MHVNFFYSLILVIFCFSKNESMIFSLLYVMHSLYQFFSGLRHGHTDICNRFTSYESNCSAVAGKEQLSKAFTQQTYSICIVELDDDYLMF